ncbi:hypothetical protein BJV78DRAFT_437956 [Lactifluus subvellereus]|nr:hypothetical protein BJV78DRAFT_437956 [Lactifluus subvellereus]
MRPSQTVVRVLLIASVANSALAASSSPAPEEEEIHNVKRAKLPKLPADFNENAKNLLKTTGTVGAIAGLFSGLGSAFQRLIIAPGGSSSTTSNATYALLLSLALLSTLPRPESRQTSDARSLAQCSGLCHAEPWRAHPPAHRRPRRVSVVVAGLVRLERQGSPVAQYSFPPGDRDARLDSSWDECGLIWGYTGHHRYSLYSQIATL